jgi:recombination protein RecR
MNLSPTIQKLIDSFRCLPGIGPKSAQRLVFYILERNKDGGKQLAETLLNALDKITHCEYCRTLCESTRCSICSNLKRDNGHLCIVENPIDILSIEQTGSFKGRYFVLMGHLSPIDGIGPKELGIDLLQRQIKKGGVSEITLAINPTVEGLATIHYLTELIKPFKIKVTQLAQGIPLGSELDYIDGNTLAHAFNAREILDEAHRS